MKPLAVIDLIKTRMAELGINKVEIIRRIGYANHGKGYRKLEALMEGDLKDNPYLFDGLPGALEIPPEAFREALAESHRQMQRYAEIAAEEAEAAWRDAFVPHAIIRTERTVPSQITLAVMVGIKRLLHIDFDLTKPPVTFFDQAMADLPNHLTLTGAGYVPFFGKPLGFFINLTPDRCIVYDLEGNPLEVLDAAYRIGDGVIKIGGRPVPPALLRGDALEGPEATP